MVDSSPAKLYIMCSLSRIILCGRYADISFAGGGTDDGFCIDGKPRLCPPNSDHRCHLCCYACSPSNTSYVYVNEFFGGCPTNLSSTEATTWSHSERVAYVCFLSSGEDAADEHVHTTQLLGVSLIQTDVFNQSVFYHVLLLMRGPFSPGSHYRLKAK